MTTSQTVLIVGEGGYIGTNIYSQLVNKGITSKVRDRLFPANPLNISTLDFDYFSLNSEFSSSFIAVVWFAGHSSIHESVSDPEAALSNNFLNLFAFAKKLMVITNLLKHWGLVKLVNQKQTKVPAFIFLPQIQTSTRKEKNNW